MASDGAATAPKWVLVPAPSAASACSSAIASSLVSVVRRLRTRPTRRSAITIGGGGDAFLPTAARSPVTARGDRSDAVVNNAGGGRSAGGGHLQRWRIDGLEGPRQRLERSLPEPPGAAPPAPAPRPDRPPGRPRSAAAARRSRPRRWPPARLLAPWPLPRSRPPGRRLSPPWPGPGAANSRRGPAAGEGRRSPTRGRPGGRRSFDDVATHVVDADVPLSRRLERPAADFQRLGPPRSSPHSGLAAPRPRVPTPARWSEHLPYVNFAPWRQIVLVGTGPVGITGVLCFYWTRGRARLGALTAGGPCRSTIYLDHAATTPVRPEVLEAMLPYFGARFGNPPASTASAGRPDRRWTAPATPSPQRWAAAPRRSFSPPAAARAITWQSRARLCLPRARDAYYHDAGRAPCRPAHLRMARALFRVRGDLSTSRRYGMVDLAALEAGLTERTILVSVMLANNEVGTIQPLRGSRICCAHAAFSCTPTRCRAAARSSLDVSPSASTC